jgi:hypothetical protein
MDETGLTVSLTPTLRLPSQTEGKKNEKPTCFYDCDRAVSGAAVGMSQSGRASNEWQSSSVRTARATSEPYRDGLHLGRLVVAHGGECHISAGRWTKEADHASFKAGFQQGHDAGLVLRASKGSANYSAQLPPQRLKALTSFHCS